MSCLANCSGHGECQNGSCHCMIQFEGSECSNANFSWHVGFSSIFFILSLTSLIQLGMCVHAEYLRLKTPSVARACRLTTQKLVYILVFLAATLRGTYFATPFLGPSLAASLMSAYYPVLLTLSSLVVCFWAEVFHLQEVRWERPRFLSKSWLGFVIFNIITYSLLVVEVFLIWFDYDDHMFYIHVFNGCYAGLMLIVVTFFLIYGVEVFFKVRGGFAEQRVAQIMNSRRNSDRRQRARKLLEAKEGEVRKEISLVSSEINQYQLQQSRLGLLSQATMMMITVGFLLSETISEFWKEKVDLSSRNTRLVIFRVVEIGVALWFPCVLWNCIRPEQLWFLNPKKILTSFSEPHSTEQSTQGSRSSSRDSSCSASDTSEAGECWICYDGDRTDAGKLIQPCGCKGDVGSVHHDCLVRWLVEISDKPKNLICSVCHETYQVERGSQFSLSQGLTTKHWICTAGLILLMILSVGGCCAAIQMYTEAWVRMLAVGLALLVQYVCLKFLGLTTLTVFQRAKVYSLKVISRGQGGPAGGGSGGNLQCDELGVELCVRLQASGRSGE